MYKKRYKMKNWVNANANFNSNINGIIHTPTEYIQKVFAYDLLGSGAFLLPLALSKRWCFSTWTTKSFLMTWVMTAGSSLPILVLTQSIMRNSGVFVGIHIRTQIKCRKWKRIWVFPNFSRLKSHFLLFFGGVY